MLGALNREHGQTFVLVTHAPEVSARTGRVITMNDGAIVADTPHPQHGTEMNLDLLPGA
jgi:predicted ABC-type transport system involved in lysophospholipase L1 biosynthesis ATPase subunit